MRLNDLPVLSIFSIDFGAVPAGFCFARIGDVIECQHSSIADNLHQWVEQFEAIKLYLAPDFFIERGESFQSVDPFFAVGIEIDYLRRRDFEKTGWIAVAPTLEGGTFHGYDRRRNICWLRHVFLNESRLLSSLLNIDFDVDRVAEWGAIRCDGLPLTLVEICAEGSGEDNADRGLGPGAGGIEGHLFGSAESVSVGVAQAVVRVPVAGAVVFDQPLLVDDLALVESGIVGDGRIRYEFQAVGAICRAEGRCESRRDLDGWEGRWLDDDLLGGLDDERRFDERRRLCGGNERCRCGEGGTGGGKEKNQNNGEQASAWKETRGFVGHILIKPLRHGDTEFFKFSVHPCLIIPEGCRG